MMTDTSRMLNGTRVSNPVIADDASIIACRMHTCNHNVIIVCTDTLDVS